MSYKQRALLSTDIPVPLTSFYVSVPPSSHKSVCIILMELLEIGNRYCNNLQVVVVERIRRYGSHSLAEYVSVVRSLLRQQQRALFG